MKKANAKPCDYRLAIGIRDNDFFSMLSGILTTIGDVIDLRGCDDPQWSDPGKIEQLVSSMAESHYWMYQVHSRIGDVMDEYLRDRMDVVYVYINEAFDRVLEDRRAHNGELCFLDMRLPRDQRVYTL